jgi:hypothetical protein
MTAAGPTFFETEAAFRLWLAANHDKSDELLVGFWKKGTGRPSIRLAPGPRPGAVLRLDRRHPQVDG